MNFMKIIVKFRILLIRNLPFEKSGYDDYQVWSDRWAKAKGRVDSKKYRKNVKLLRVKDYENIDFWLTKN